jgi:hypothetical protein
MARAAGMFSLLTILTGILAEVVIGDRLIVSGDAAATAARILAHRDLLRLGFAVYMVEMACDVASTVFFYELLRPVSRSLSLLAAFWSLTGCVIKAMSRLFFVAPLLVLGGASYLSVFTPQQLQALAYLLIKVNATGAGIGLIFFGFASPVRGYLILRSTFLPRILGVLGIISGLGWLLFLYPPLAYPLFPYLAGFGILGAVVEIGWLLVVGVNERRWYAVAGATAREVR